MEQQGSATQLLALSFDCASSPSITLRGVGATDRPFGWGFAWYPAEDYAALVIKDPTSIGDNAMTKVLRDWERFQSDIFVCHLRGAARRVTQEDTQPFTRSYAGRDWIFAHNGDLTGDLPTALPLGDSPDFEPVGHTDSEHAFCWFLTAVREQGARRLADLGWQRLHDWLRCLNDLGTTNLVLTDGEDLVVYQDRGRFNCLHWLRRVPPHPSGPLETGELALELGSGNTAARTVVLVSTTPLSPEPWRPFHAGQMLVLRRGAVLWDSHTGVAPEAGPAPLVVRRRLAPRQQLLSVVHETVYRYTAPVERSVHHFRLRPVYDLRQHLLEYRLAISTGGLRQEFEDVFGNQVLRLTIESPFREMRIESRSLVRVQALPPLEAQVPRRVTLPLVWMPWQRQMMNPYLLPLELPEEQLRELSAYAMSFAQRQDFDLLETLVEMNATIHADYAYVSGSTSVETTPFEVYGSRRGVCQDFTNLLICLARLLNIPARYRTGYIFTGADYDNKVQSEASHAWAELYIPEVGWRGFDPTNGCLTGGDHVRVACGRSYRDAAPTGGTIYAGGGGETLGVSVRVEQMDDPASTAGHS
jgi:transglutaminase-like putative cysteine protease/predicted glutamine amidotransferase